MTRSEDVFDLSLPFYKNGSSVREAWLRVYSTLRWESTLLDLPVSLPYTDRLLNLASFLGILPLAETILIRRGFINMVKRQLFIDKRDDYGKTALSWATEYEHEAVVSLLLATGANTEAKDEFGLTALSIAALKGNEAVVRLLTSPSHEEVMISHP